MREEMLEAVSKARWMDAPHGYESSALDGYNGLFLFSYRGAPLKVMCSDGLGWEHVSVSHPKRCPTWDEMCFIKGLFWDDEEVVMQLHPAKHEYVNIHPFCLHLWKPCSPNPARIPEPPSIFVGPRPQQARQA